MIGKRNTLQYQEFHTNSSKYFNSCWMKIDPSTNISFFQSNNTNYVYSEVESTLAGLLYSIESGGGLIMNVLLIMALLRSTKLYKEYLTPSIISISLNHVLYCVYSLPVQSLHFFLNDMPVGCQLYAFITYGLWLGSALHLSLIHI